MTNDDPRGNDSTPESTHMHSQLFTVRLWLEDPTDEATYRGQVRSVISGANRGFRAWSELTDFMLARLQEAAWSQLEETVRER
jgi:hypothetical protein